MAEKWARIESMHFLWKMGDVPACYVSLPGYQRVFRQGSGSQRGKNGKAAEDRHFGEASPDDIRSDGPGLKPGPSLSMKKWPAKKQRRDEMRQKTWRFEG